jgi:hypothetical protein
MVSLAKLLRIMLRIGKKYKNIGLEKISVVHWRLRRKNTILATASLILLCLALFGRNLDQSWLPLYSLQFFCNLYSFFDEFESFWYTMFVNLVFQTVPRRYTCEYHLLVSPFFVWYHEVNSNIFEIFFSWFLGPMWKFLNHTGKVIFEIQIFFNQIFRYLH